MIIKGDEAVVGDLLEGIGDLLGDGGGGDLLGGIGDLLGGGGGDGVAT